MAEPSKAELMMAYDLNTYETWLLDLAKTQKVQIRNREMENYRDIFKQGWSRGWNFAISQDGGQKLLLSGGP